MRSIGNPEEFHCLSPAPMKESDFSMHSVSKFKCNFAVIGVVHSGINMTRTYFREFRWDENCCSSLHKYKDYTKTHPLPQYAHMINFIPITQMVLWRRVAQHARDIREWRNAVQPIDNIVFSFTWDHTEFKVWVLKKLVHYDGVVIKNM